MDQCNYNCNKIKESMVQKSKSSNFDQQDQINIHLEVLPLMKHDTPVKFSKNVKFSRLNNNKQNPNFKSGNFSFLNQIPIYFFIEQFSLKSPTTLLHQISKIRSFHMSIEHLYVIAAPSSHPTWDCFNQLSIKGSNINQVS